MLPQITKLEFKNETVELNLTSHKTFLWDFNIGDFVIKDGKLVVVEGIDYIKIWIEKALRTKANTSVYTNYGSEHHNLIGKVFDREFTNAELERTIREALLKNNAITNAYNFKFQLDEDLLNIEFTVSTIYGESDVIINL